MLGDKALHPKAGGQPLIGGLHVVVDRNHFGTQLQSFETDLDADKRVLGEGGAACRAMFIRAPAIMEILDPTVQVCVCVCARPCSCVSVCLCMCM
jgi:5'-phosphate synthase pdxT subunit